MEFDLGNAVTERQLVAALAAGGRIISLAEISNWRKNGLLPPLASHGRGPGKGKAHCWHQKDIMPRAATVFDAIKRQGRADHALLMLFLSGFDVSLPRLRRAWAAHIKQRRPPAIGKAALAARASAPEDLLLQPVEAIVAAIQGEEYSPVVIGAVEQALARLGYGRRVRARRLCHTVAIMALALEASDLICKAETAQMRMAQRYLGIAITFLDSRNEKRGQLIEAIGPALFAYILALIRSGQNAALERIATRIGQMDRPVPPRPVHILRDSPQGVSAAE